MQDLEKDIAIDPHNLHEEWMKQPVLYFYYSELLSKKEKEKKSMKSELEIFEASLTLRIIKNPGKYKLPDNKPTSNIISSVVKSSKKHIHLHQKMDSLEGEVSTLRNILVAIDRHKKKALESLVQLHVTGYFSAPLDREQIKEGKRTKKRIDRMEKEERENLNRRKGKKKGKK